MATSRRPRAGSPAARRARKPKPTPAVRTPTRRPHAAAPTTPYVPPKPKPAQVAPANLGVKAEAPAGLSQPKLREPEPIEQPYEEQKLEELPGPDATADWSIPPTTPELPIDAKVRNFTFAYFQMHDRMPSPEKTLDVMATQPPGIQTVQDYLELLAPSQLIGEKPDEYSVVPYKPLEDGDWYGGEPTFKRQDYHLMWGQPDFGGYQGTIAYVRDPKPGDTLYDRLIQQNDQEGIATIRTIIARRAEEQGEKNPYSANLEKTWTLDDDNNFGRYVAGRQYGYLLWGDEKEQDNAGNIIDSVVYNGLGSRNALVNTVAAMQFKDDEAVKSLAYNGWQFGRSTDQSEAASRWQYAKEFGEDKLPADALAQYQGEIHSVEGAVMGAPGWVAGKAADIPVVGGVLTTAYEAIKYMNEIPMVPAPGAERSALKGEDAKRYSPLQAEKAAIGAMAWACAEADRALVTAVLMGKGNDVGGLVSADKWGQKYKEAEGRQFVRQVAEDFGLDTANPFVNMSIALGELYLWTKMGAVGDSAMWGTARVAGRGAYKATRALAMPKMVNGVRVAEVEVLTADSARAARIAERAAREPPAVAPVTAARTAERTAANTEPVAVDNGIAPEIQRLNEGGYRTVGSHSGLDVDHARNHPARVSQAEGYIEIDPNSVARGGTKTIRAAAKEAGLKVERGQGQEGASNVIRIVNAYDDDATMAGRWTEFGDALLGPKTRVAANPLVPPILWNAAEHLTHGTTRGNEAAIRRAYNIPWTKESRHVVAQIAKSKSVEQTVGLLRKLAVKYHIEIDPMATALVRRAKMNRWIEAQGAGRFPLVDRMFTTISFDRKFHLEDSDEHMWNIGKGTRIGAADYTPEVAQRVAWYANRLYMAADNTTRQNVWGQFWAEVDTNLKARPWKNGKTQLDHYQSWVDNLRSKQAKAILGHRRSYVGDFVRGADGEIRIDPETRMYMVKSRDRIVPFNTNRRLAAQRTSRHKELEKILADSGATPEEVRAVRGAVKVADKEFDDFCRAAQIRAMGPDKVTATEWKFANEVYTGYESPQPFMVGQLMKHGYHEHDPRMLTRFMQGGTGRALETAHAKGLGWAMRRWKEVVFASLGFPVRVTVGDELARWVPYGLLNPKALRTAHKTKKELRASGRFGTISERLHEDLNNWYEVTSDNWVSVPPQHPLHYRGFNNDVNMLSREPIVIRYLEVLNATGSEEKAIAAMRELPMEASGAGADVRKLLQDTQRISVRTAGKVNTVPTEEWLDLWEGKLVHIGRNQRLRAAVESGHISEKDYKALDPKDLWPVNVTNEPVYYAGWERSWKEPKNLWLPGAFTNYAVYPLLGRASNTMRDYLFSHYYHKFEGEILSRHPDIHPDELHRVVASKSMSATLRGSYTRSATILEDELRDVVPFINAYRQFAVAWGKIFAKNPIAMTAYYANYPSDPFVNLGAVGAEDYNIYMPPVPFWADKTEGSKGTDILKQQGPLLGPMPALMLKGANELIPGNPLDGMWDYPMLDTTSPRFAIGGRPAEGLYGITGWDLWLLGKDPNTLRKIRNNIALGQIHDGQKVDVDGGLKEMMDKPWWFRALESVGIHDPPSVLGAMTGVAGTKLSYMPNEEREWESALYQVGQLRDDPNALAAFRAENPRVDTWMRYWESDSADRERMLETPGNEWLAARTVSKYAYAPGTGELLVGNDFFDNLYAKNVTVKDRDRYLGDIQNKYVDIWGGDYTDVTTYDSNRTLWEYGGNIARPEAEKRENQALAQARKWAEREALKRTHGKKNDKFRFYMEKWVHTPLVIDRDTGLPKPHEMWGFFDDAARKSKDLVDPALIRHGFTSKWGDTPAGPAQPPAAEDIDKMLAIARVSGPDTERLLMRDSGVWGDIEASIEDKKAEALADVVNAAYETTYSVDANQLVALGVVKDPTPQKNRIINEALARVENDPNHGWTHFQSISHKYGSSSDEYKRARNDYYAFRDRMYSKIPGGDALKGGLADRLAYIPYFSQPNLATIGTGRHAARTQMAYDKFVAEYRKDSPDEKRVNKLWNALAPTMRRNELEKSRVGYWVGIVTATKIMRNRLKKSYSEYYDAPGNSAASTDGVYYAGVLNKALKEMAARNPLFADDLDRYFHRVEIGSSLIEWYWR